MVERLQSIAVQAVRAQTTGTALAADLLDDIESDLRVARQCANQLLIDGEASR
jgi:hypothetical protein